jgi:ornithine cyclodeaminase
MLFLNAHQIHESVTYRQVTEGVREALCIYEDGAYVMPERMAVPCRDARIESADDLLLLMPCVALDSIATKLVTVFPGNRARGRPVIDGMVILAERASGQILALMDGKAITALRTGAVTGVSVDCLSRADVRSVGLAGCGVQGFYQLVYACTVRDVRHIALYDVNPTALPPMIDRLRAALPGVEVEAVPSPRALLEASEVVITATTSRTPVFPDEPELFHGKHCVAIGSFEPDVREYPDAVFSLVEKVWVDIDFARHESGELIVPLEKGLLREDQLETLGHLIRSGREPERGAYGTTFSKSVGMALFDLTTARLVHARAVEKGLGTRLDVG